MSTAHCFKKQQEPDSGTDTQGPIQEFLTGVSVVPMGGVDEKFLKF